MEAFQFDKGMPSDIFSATAKMDSLFDVVFEQMVYFGQELDRHTGKAANQMKKNMEEDIDFFSKASFSLMTFMEMVKRFITSVDIVDEGADLDPPSGGTRAEREYWYSAAKAEEEIKVDPMPLDEATASYESNLQDFDEMLTGFSKALDNIMDHTDFPWGAVNDIWPEAKDKIASVINEFEHRVEKMIKDSEDLVKELERVDNLISQQMGHAE